MGGVGGITNVFLQDHEADGGRTALMKAAKAGHYCVVQYLIQRGAQVNKSTIANDATALSLASTHGHYDVVQLLLQNGANPNHKLKVLMTTLRIELFRRKCSFDGCFCRRIPK